MLERVFIAGGAGFVGGHFCRRLLSLATVQQVTIFDNFSSGRAGPSVQQSDARLKVVRGEIHDTGCLQAAMAGHDTIIHLASNPDIARAASEPTIDFVQGTVLTQQIVEAMRVTGAKRILYASGSGVYGEVGSFETSENFGPMLPVSTYGASKLAGEALISAYSYMFGLSGIAFRFGNIVGQGQTHGVGYDFIQKLQANPDELSILGDGSQSKSYIYVSDVVNAVLLANEKTSLPFDVFNVATGDYITVKEIAEIAVELVLGKNANVKFKYGGGSRGWKGDVPVVRLNTDKIKALGWSRQYSSAQAIAQSISEMLAEQKKLAESFDGAKSAVGQPND